MINYQLDHMDKGKELKPDASILIQARVDILTGDIQNNTNLSRRTLSLAKEGVLPIEPPPQTPEAQLKLTPRRFLQRLSDLFKKQPEPIRVREEVQE